VELEGEQTGALMPPDIKALARVFPVLRRVEENAELALASGPPLYPQDVRLRAFRALRELLARIASQHLLVLHLDDLQWGDSDSAALLGDLLRAPELPPLLLIGSYRSEDAEQSPLVPLLPRPGTALAALDVREVVTSTLAQNEARELALALFGDRRSRALDLAEVIARESNGHPYPVVELVRHVKRGA